MRAHVTISRASFVAIIPRMAGTQPLQKRDHQGGMIIVGG